MKPSLSPCGRNATITQPIPQNAVRLGRAFTTLGFEFRRTKTSRGYIVVQRTAEEIKSRLRAMADDG